MGLFDLPKSPRKLSDGNIGGGISYGLSSAQGRRRDMQDDHNAIAGIPQIKNDVSWFAVFDGHGGSSVSKHCSEHLFRALTMDTELINVLESGLEKGDKEQMKTVKTSISKGFLATDRKIKTIEGAKDSGSTAVCVLITKTHIIMMNCGDSRGIICTNINTNNSSVICKPTITTVDHKPEMPSELARIQAANGYVFNNRLKGVLGVSRSFGDFKYKGDATLDPLKQMITPEPDFYIKIREPKKDEFLILACDGVWDVMSLDEVCDYVHSNVRKFDAKSLKSVSEEIVDLCLAKGSMDNITIIIIDLASPSV